MKLLVLSAVVLVSSALAAPEDYHETLDDEFDFSALEGSQIKDVALCLCDKAPCSDLLKSYKQHMADANKEACRRCKPSHKKSAAHFFDLLIKEQPQIILKCVAKYDPQGKYMIAFYNGLRT